MDGDGAMLEDMADSDGVEAGAEELDPVLEPPQAVRLSMAAAAIPATAKVVRLMVCISILLCCADFIAFSDVFAAVAFLRLSGTDPGGGAHWVFAGLAEREGGEANFFCGPGSGGRGGGAASPGFRAFWRVREGRSPV